MRMHAYRGLFNQGDKMSKFNKTAIAVGVAQFMLMASGTACAQTTPASDNGTATVVVVGQRASVENAQ